MKQYIFLYFFLFCCNLVAQQTRVDFQYSNAPLQQVLSELESAYAVKFSYNSETIGAFEITIDLNEADITTAISTIEKQTALIIEQIDARYYVVKQSTQATLCGYLKDEGGNVIEGASVFVETSQKGTISNQQGYYTLDNIAITDTLSIRYIGFKTLILPVKDIITADCTSFTMISENFMLNEVVIQEYLAAGILKNRDGSVKITPQNLEILSGLSEPDILQNTQLLPGIDSPSETASGLFIRGGTPDQNLILWDGIKMYNSDHFFGMLSAFNPYIVEEVTVYRSGTKVMYGDRVSGVIDIKTDSNITTETKGGFGLNLTHFDAFIRTPLSDKTSIQLSGRRALTDVFNSPTFNQFTQKVFQNTSITQNQDVFEPEYTESKELFKFSDVTLKINTAPSEKDKISISSIYTNNKLDYSYEDIEFIDASSDQLDVSNFGASLLWKRNWNTSFNTAINTYYSSYDFEYTGATFFNEDEFISIKKNTIEEFGFSLHTDLKINENITFSNGYQFFNNQVAYQLEEEDYIETDDANNPTHALYNQLQLQPEKWFINLGLRTNYNTILSSVYFEPRLYLENKITHNLRIKASAEIKNQSVSQIIEFTTQDFGLENQVWALTDDDLIPLLQSKQFSGGFLWHKNGWNLDLDFYNKNIIGLTSLTRGFETSTNNFAEGQSSTLGMDLLLKKKIGSYSTWLGYTFSETTFEFEELNNGKAFLGNNNITHSLTWSHFYKLNKLQFSLGWKYRTGIPYTSILGTTGSGDNLEILYDTINAATLPDYHRLDFSVLYDFQISEKKNTRKAKLGFSLLNIYGRQNLLSKSYDLFNVIDDQQNNVIELQEITKYSLGTTPTLVFRLHF